MGSFGEMGEINTSLLPSSSESGSSTSPTKFRHPLHDLDVHQDSKESVTHCKEK